jgi:hypothetical protein
MERRLKELEAADHVRTRDERWRASRPPTPSFIAPGFEVEVDDIGDLTYVPTLRLGSDVVWRSSVRLHGVDAGERARRVASEHLRRALALVMEAAS